MSTVAAQAQQAKKLAAAARRAARVQAKDTNSNTKKLKRHTPPRDNTLLNKSENLAKEVAKLPTQVFDVLKKSF